MGIPTLKSWHFEASEDIITKFKSKCVHTISIKYWNASGSGSPPSLIPAVWNIGGLLHKQATLGKHFRPECMTQIEMNFDVKCALMCMNQYGLKVITRNVSKKVSLILLWLIYLLTCISSILGTRKYKWMNVTLK